jgi:signal transduction histidine kinase
MQLPPVGYVATVWQLWISLLCTLCYIVRNATKRKRLSRELHDETVQDLVGLVQRLELCRNEIIRKSDEELLSPAR